MSLDSLLAFAGALLLAAVIPGPGILGLLGWTLGKGKRAAVGYAIGLVIGDMTYLALAVLGLAALAQTMGEAFLLVKIAGGLYLAYMGIKIWRSRPTQGNTQLNREGSLMAAVLGGLTTTLANPKTIVFYMGIMPLVVDMHAITVPIFFELAAITATVLIAVVTPYALAANKARRMIQTPQAMARLNKGAGAAMVSAGTAVVVS